MSYFKKFGNIASCRVYSRRNAKVQQARIVYDSDHSIARFDTQWAVYCFSTCLRVTPCYYMVDQKSFHRKFVATLTQLPPNTKDIDLAPLTRDLGAKAVNVPLSLNSYKPKRWAYVTFNSQETMDAAMEQIIGCAPNQCPSRQEWGRTREETRWLHSKNVSISTNLPGLKNVHAQVLIRARARKVLATLNPPSRKNPWLILEFMPILTRTALNPMINETVQFPFPRSCIPSSPFITQSIYYYVSSRSC
ncbi:hypothetical protein RclHR1_13070013 [Rhizophagus clarus]|uniref:RRM domain-containing protein n=1 Tax=Rhizophagus clarus TaxID=94130 RepID=A0A2Z6Q972_9GLOM|nr:hypothetical protein RclHR1_13070013 [Rhizophagus clarus]